MGPQTNVYIAGVGFAPLPTSNSSRRGGITALVSSATKALLDAGITYDSVTQGIRTAKSAHFSYGADGFQTFDEGGIFVEEVEAGSELDASVRYVKDRGSDCTLMLAIEKSSATTLILVSENFLWRRPFLKDSAALVQVSTSTAHGKGNAAYDICEIVWALRGWSRLKGVVPGQDACLSFTDLAGRCYEFSRADARAIPEWKAVEHRNDGKHRLGYNPATETRDISLEDFEAVRAHGRGHSDWIDVQRKGGDRAALARL